MTAKTDPTEAVLALIRTERIRQLDKWGIQHHSDAKWICINTEELGEAANEVNNANETGQDTHEALVQELVQVAAVAVAHIEDIMSRCSDE